MIDCFVLLFFGLLISTLAFLQMINPKKGCERNVRLFETMIRWFGKNPYYEQQIERYRNKPGTAFIEAICGVIIGSFFLIAAAYCFFQL